jgi:hypothetical protein
MGWTIGIYGRMGVGVPLHTEELRCLLAVRPLAQPGERVRHQDYNEGDGEV